MSHSKKRRRSVKSRAADLNLMPFIDIFAMLNTFLLISASFVNLGIVTVQIPFFANTPKKDEKPQRAFVINVNVSRDKAELETKYTEAPTEENKQNFTVDKTGMSALHQALVKLRTGHPDTDKLTLFSDDDVKYATMMKVLDAIKVLQPGDPQITVDDEKLGTKRKSAELYEKVVIGSVVL